MMKKTRERAYLVGIAEHGDEKSIADSEYSLQELHELTLTAGAEIAGSEMVKRRGFDPTYIFGKGKAEQIRDTVKDKKIDLVILDINDTKPSQIKNLEDLLECRVISRTEVILDIFAIRANSAESQIQIELAQLSYSISHLRGIGAEMSRLGGGIGTRGPGETKLETDRRHILSRISRLKKKLKEYESARTVKRKSRGNQFKIAVVGYTNAGKSSLINRLSKSDLFVENRLFATLDSFTRTVYLKEGLIVLMTDTVGFIRNLPATLVHSFRSTLEEIEYCDIILHLVDISGQDVESCIQTVRSEMEHLEVDKPVITVFNKCDLADIEKVQAMSHLYPESLFCSVKQNEGLDAVKQKLVEAAELIRV
jgi:GTPase